MYFNCNDTDLSKAVRDPIKSWESDSDNKLLNETFLEYTRGWADRINRGGLFSVNDDSYIFVRRVENVARTVLNSNLIIKYKGKDLRDVLMKNSKQVFLLI